MNWKSLGRLLVCLVLVCVILVNCSPIRAEAVAATTFALVSGLTVLGSCLIGLGLAAGDNQEAFYEVCTMIAQHPKILPYFDADGNIRIPRFSLEDGELSPWLVPAVLLQAIRGVLKDEGILIDGGESVNGVPDDRFDNDVYYGKYLLPQFIPGAEFPYYVVFWTTENGFYYVLTFSSLPFLRDGDFYSDVFTKTQLYRANKYADGSCVWSYYSSSTWSAGSQIKFASFGRSAIYANFSLCGADGNVLQSFPEPTQSLLSTDYDLTLFDVAPLDQELAQGYPDWALGQIQDEDENYWYPLGLNQTLDQTLGLTQEQVQKGEGNFEQTQDQEQTQTQIPGLIQGFQDKVTTWFARLSLNQLNILDLLGQIPELIVSPVVQALEYIFVPSQDFLTDKVQTLRQEFVFADTLITGGQMIGDAFNGFDTSPPIIYIDLGATRGDYDIGGKVPFIDLTWYEEYKPTVDMLLSSFLWVVFIWKLFQKAPGIISGMPGDFVMEGLQQLNMDVYLPMRSQSHEKVRRLNRRSKL